jgi:hypothetical protein
VQSEVKRIESDEREKSVKPIKKYVNKEDERKNCDTNETIKEMFVCVFYINFSLRTVIH